jgi:hypothetical protein
VAETSHELRLLEDIHEVVTTRTDRVIRELGELRAEVKLNTDHRVAVEAARADLVREIRRNLVKVAIGVVLTVAGLGTIALIARALGA